MAPKTNATAVVDKFTGTGSVCIVQRGELKHGEVKYDGTEA